MYFAHPPVLFVIGLLVVVGLVVSAPIGVLAAVLFDRLSRRAER